MFVPIRKGDNSTISSGRTVMFDIEDDNTAPEKESRNGSQHSNTLKQIRYRKFEDITTELFRLSSRDNLLLIMVYFLLVVMFLYAVLELARENTPPEVRCEIKELAKTHWSFYQKRNISCPVSNKRQQNIGCFYYAFNYSLLALLPYEAALEEIQSISKKTAKKECEKYVYKDLLPYSLSVVQEFDLICNKKNLQSFFFYLEIGNAIAGFPSGIAADIYGRKPVYIFGAVIIVIGSCLIPTATTFHFFVAAKIITSIGFTIVFHILIVLFTELWYNKYLSLLVVLSFATEHAGIFAYEIVFPTISVWRLLELANACPLLIVLFGIMFVPESPRWLMLNRKWKTAWEVLQEMGSLETEIPLQNDDKVPRSTISKQLYIFRKPSFQHKTSVNVILNGIVPIMVYTIETLKYHVIEHAYKIKIPMSGVLFISIILTGGLIHICNKKRICCNLFLLLALCFIASVISNTKDVSDITLILAEIFAEALVPIIYINILHLFPTTHRATAFGVGVTTSGITAMVFLQYEHELTQKIDIHVLRAFLCGFSMICALITLVAPIMEEIVDTEEEFIARSASS